MLDARVLAVGVGLGDLIGGVLGQFDGDVLADDLADAVGVGPGDVAELVVEGLEDIRFDGDIIDFL